MFNSIQPIRMGTVQRTPTVHKQPETVKATHNPNFGLTTVSFGKTNPITPRPVPPKTQGTRLDYYA